MDNGLLGTGIDVVCAALTLVYIARLLAFGMPMGSPVRIECGVSKISLKGQQIARRLR
jgi:hypothetical protein